MKSKVRGTMFSGARPGLRIAPLGGSIHSALPSRAHVALDQMQQATSDPDCELDGAASERFAGHL